MNVGDELQLAAGFTLHLKDEELVMLVCAVNVVPSQLLFRLSLASSGGGR